MYLPAISIGYAVPSGNFNASVHSVFRSAINLRPSGRGELLTLVTSSEADLPQGVRVDTPNDFSFETFHVGEPVTCRDDSLSFNSLTVELRGAQRWKCDLPALEFDSTNPAVAEAWLCVWKALNKQKARLNAEITEVDLFHLNESVRTGMCCKAGKAMRDLVHATRRYKSIDPSVVNSLIGLGSGLTPSGDDLLVGYMAGLWCALRGKSERLQFILNLGNEVLRFSSNTNDISRTYLYHATRGQVSSLLVDLAESICRGENSAYLIEVAEAAMGVGHNSGIVTVAGLLLGLAAWDGDHLLKDTNKTGSQFSLVKALL